MSRVTTDEQLQSIAEQLIGQCSNGIDDVCHEDDLPLFDQWTVEDATAFDELAFLCSVCGWWVSGDSHAEVEPDDFVCTECGEENNQ